MLCFNKNNDLSCILQNPYIMKNIISALVILFLFSCSSKKEGSNYGTGQYESTAPSASYDRSAESDKQDVAKSESNAVQEERIDKKVIRTAETKFKVKDVKKATKDIETITADYDGFIQSSELRSDIQRTEYMRLSADSLLEVQEVCVSNNITLRIPIEKFDTVLHKFEKLQVFLDYRRINADDVSLTYYSNKLKIKNKLKSQQRIQQAIDNKGKKLGEIIAAEQTAAEMENEAVDNTINNLSIDEKVNFSTIIVYLYQPNFTFKNVVPDYNVDSYSPSFWHRMGAALNFGWKIVLELIIFLAGSWSVLLMLGSITYAIIYFTRKKLKSIEK
jgi:hypothetical protein